jgi:hypothetical protein
LEVAKSTHISQPHIWHLRRPDALAKHQRICTADKPMKSVARSKPASLTEPPPRPPSSTPKQTPAQPAPPSGGSVSTGAASGDTRPSPRRLRATAAPADGAGTSAQEPVEPPRRPQPAALPRDAVGKETDRSSGDHQEALSTPGYEDEGAAAQVRALPWFTSSSTAQVAPQVIATACLPLVG